MAEENVIPDVLDYDTIPLDPDEPQSFVAWGIKWKFLSTDKWYIVPMAFRKKVDAEDWAKVHYGGGVSEIIPIRQFLLWNSKTGKVIDWQEEL